MTASSTPNATFGGARNPTPCCAPVGALATQGLTLMVWRTSHQTTAPMSRARNTSVAVMDQPSALVSPWARAAAISSEGTFCGMKSSFAPGTP